MKPLVIIPCGSKKATTPQPAQKLYLGNYFKACLRYALRKTTPDRIRILSGKHGLLNLTQVVTPYEMRLGDPGSVSAADIRTQADKQGISGEQHVLIVAGKVYAGLAKKVWPQATWVLQGKGRMGYQMSYLNEAA